MAEQLVGSMADGITTLTPDHTPRNREERMKIEPRLAEYVPSNRTLLITVAHAVQAVCESHGQPSPFKGWHHETFRDTRDQELLIGMLRGLGALVGGHLRIVITSPPWDGSECVITASEERVEWSLSLTNPTADTKMPVVKDSVPTLKPHWAP